MGSGRNICSYFGNLYSNTFRDHVFEMRRWGFDTLCLCVTEADFKWNFPQIDWMVRHAKKYHMEVWLDPWGVGKLFDGEAFSEKGVGCLEDGATWTALHTWIMNACKTKADAIFWDNPRDKYHRLDRSEKFLSFLDEVTFRAYQSGKDSFVSLSAIETWPQFEFFEKVAALKHVTGIGTDPYCLTPSNIHDFDVEEYVGEWSRIIKSAADTHSKQTHIWVQGFNLPIGWHTLPVTAANVARKNGIKDIGFWGFRACEALSHIRPAEHELVWHTYKEALPNGI